MEKHRCKLCFRRFSNGRALGGHMRSHVAQTAARSSQPRPPPVFQAAEAPRHASPSLSASSSFSAAAEAKPEVGKVFTPTYVLRENPRKSIRLVDAEFSASFAAVAGSSSVVQEGESDAESSLRRRPKRRREAASPSELGDGEPLSSISDASSEEDVARFLVLLSRDAWSRFEAGEQRYCNEEYDELDDEEDDGGGEEEERIAAAVRSRRRRTKYQCGNCCKVFGSYQALGGHRASHKRVGMDCVPTSGLQIHSNENNRNVGNREAKIFECPYCYRIFSSGQALGGHKRSHFTSSVASSSSKAAALAAITATATFAPAVLPPPPHADSYAISKQKSGIDLNLPAPMEEEAELSAVSMAVDFRS